jgi:predicted nucleotidyltransferase
MAEGTEKSALEELAEVLLAHGVEFVVVGGQAEVLLGSPRVTYDVVLCYRRAKGNLDRLAIGDYDAIADRAIVYRVGELELKVIALDDLIAIKEHIGRPKDRESLLQLHAIRRLRDERG